MPRTIVRRTEPVPDERDDLIERTLRRSALGSAPDGACLDAETAAAWADGNLDEARLLQARRHAADCERCQSMMAALMAAEEHGRAEQASRAVRPSSVFSRFRWSWAVPLATAATAL